MQLVAYQMYHVHLHNCHVQLTDLEMCYLHLQKFHEQVIVYHVYYAHPQKCHVQLGDLQFHHTRFGIIMSTGTQPF